MSESGKNSEPSARSTLKLQIEEGIAIVSLHRPDVRNAFDPAMIGELTTVFGELNGRSDLAAVVLRGEGKSFCAGADLGYMKSQAEFTLQENEADAGHLFGMFWAVRSCPHPVIGSLHGHVMGGGLGLAAVCDIVAAADNTVFCFSEVKLGLAPAVISPFVLERMLPAQARRFMISGETFGAAEAHLAGLVHFVGSQADVDAFVQKTVAGLRQNGPEGMRATKKLLRTVSEVGDWDRRRELTTKVIAERRVSAEGQEGLRSFLEKRVPGWRPQSTAR